MKIAANYRILFKTIRIQFNFSMDNLKSKIQKLKEKIILAKILIKILKYNRNYYYQTLITKYKYNKSLEVFSQI